MATGYTAAIADGITFEDFVLRCARAFGSLIMMRDDPLDAPIPDEFPPSTHHKEWLQGAKAWLQEIMEMTPEQAEIRAEKAYQQASSRFLNMLKERQELKEKYSSMLSKVKAWQPPTPDHQELKTFMVEQIEESMRHDCSMESVPVRQTGEQWYKAAHVEAICDVQYHTKELEKELARAAERTAWVRALKRSLQVDG